MFGGRRSSSVINFAVFVDDRYTGRTQKELVEYVRENYVGPRPFER